MAELDKSYTPVEVEAKWQERWKSSGAFRADTSSPKEGYSIVIPPPNVTGILHLGHVLNNTIQDILARRARQEGKEVLWLPGTDHAGIATQTKVEKQCRDEGTSRAELGRENFLEKVWEWKDLHGGIIQNQLQRLGASCDWSRERFTLDEDYSRWVTRAFVDLFQQGQIYRGRRMVNWCPVSRTALSDEEVIPKPQKSKLYVMKYEIADEQGKGTGKYLEIATTRPETLMGDTGVAVNPKDERYRNLVGTHAIRPFPRALIPIVADEHIDIEFGTGVLKVTPAHDKADFEIGERHGLEIIDVLNPDGTLNEHAGPDFEGMDRFEAREKAAAMLEQMGLLVRVEDYDNVVGFSERADVPIEPRLSMQWFLRYPKVEESTCAVADDEIVFRPERWKKTYLHWMENLQDWCISRQLWWGHRVPVWYRREDAEELQDTALGVDAEGIHVGMTPPDDSGSWVQDPDVLDTWFSSWLWPFGTMTSEGEEDSAVVAKFYPTADLVTGPDIIFFWVARMIVAGYQFRGEKPFSNVFFTSIIRDRFGRKMAKQLGNSPDPIEIMDQLGADALRFSLMRIAPVGSDARFEEDRAGFKGGDDDKAARQFDQCERGGGAFPQVEAGRNFATKIWNAARYRQMQGGDATYSLPADLSAFDLDVLVKLDGLSDSVADGYARYRFAAIANELSDFFWGQFCDRYLESVKAVLREESSSPARGAAVAVIDEVFRRFLPLLHPFMPHLSEELWEKMGFAAEGELLTLHVHSQESCLAGRDSSRARRATDVYEAAARIRNLKAEYHLATRNDVPLVLVPADIWESDLSEVLALLAGASEVKADPSYKAAQGTPTVLTNLGEIAMPLEGLIDVEAERKRLGAELAKVEKELAISGKKLGNASFVDRAKPEVVEQERVRLREWSEKKEQLGKMIESLG